MTYIDLSTLNFNNAKKDPRAFIRELYEAVKGTGAFKLNADDQLVYDSEKLKSAIGTTIRQSDADKLIALAKNYAPNKTEAQKISLEDFFGPKNAKSSSNISPIQNGKRIYAEAFTNSNKGNVDNFLAAGRKFFLNENTTEVSFEKKGANSFDFSTPLSQTPVETLIIDSHAIKGGVLGFFTDEHEQVDIDTIDYCRFLLNDCKKNGWLPKKIVFLGCQSATGHTPGEFKSLSKSFPGVEIVVSPTFTFIDDKGVYGEFYSFLNCEMFKAEEFNLSSDPSIREGILKPADSPEIQENYLKWRNLYAAAARN